nr:outer membrane lipoprotein LolB [Pseudomonas sp.]
MKRLASLLLVALLSACATPPPITPDDTQATQSGVLSRTGRFAVQVDEVAGKTQAVQGGFAWYDMALRDLTLDLNSPLGAALARVEVDADGTATLTEANGMQTVADSADDLVAQVLGSPIPVAGLRYWLRGQLAPQPAARNLQRDAEGRPVAFEQGGWKVNITDFDPIGPVRMSLQRSEPGHRLIDVRLVMTPNAAP